MHTIMAFAMVLFMAGSVAAMSKILLAEVSLGEPTWDIRTPKEIRVASQPIETQVLGTNVDLTSAKAEPKPADLQKNGFPRLNQLILIDKTVYLVTTTGLYGVPSVAVLDSWGWNLDDVFSSPNSAEKSLSQVGTIFFKIADCNDPLSQANGDCDLAYLAQNLPQRQVAGAFVAHIDLMHGSLSEEGLLMMP